MKLPYLITKTSPSGHDAAAARNTCCFEFKTEIVVQITPTDGKRKSMRAAVLRGADISIAGHWSTNGATYETYMNSLSKERRAREINRRIM